MKISVTVLVYNSKAHLEEALDCLIAQTFKDFEVILFDDHSTDGSSEICQNYAKRDSRFRHTVPAKRLGLQVSRSAVLGECRGEYVAVLDSDDLSEPTRFEKQVKVITADSQIKLVTSLCGRVDDQGRKTKQPETPWLDSAALLWRLIFGNTIFHSSVMFERKLALEVGGYDPKLTTCEDADLYGRLLQHGQAYCVNEVLSYWRVHENNISRGIDNYKLKRQDALGIFQKLIKTFAHENLDLDTTEALYAHVRTPAKDQATLIKAINAIATAFTALSKKYALSNAHQTSILREALLSLADLQKTNSHTTQWAGVDELWRRTLQIILERGRASGYRWYIDKFLFWPQRQLPITMLRPLIKATLLPRKRS